MQTRQFFGTDGIRGTVGDSVINAKFMLQLGFVLGSVLGRSGGKKSRNWKRYARIGAHD